MHAHQSKAPRATLQHTHTYSTHSTAGTDQFILPTVIDAPLNYYSIRIDIPHFSETAEQGTWLRFGAWAAPGWIFWCCGAPILGGERKGPERDKNQKCHSQNQIEFDDVALNTISLRLSVRSWPFGAALPNTVYPRWAVRHCTSLLQRGM